MGESKTGQNDVFLLAGHCLPSAGDGIPAGDLDVSFDSNATVTDTHEDVASTPIQVQSYHQMPGFGHDLGDLHDLAILLLPRDSVPSPLRPFGRPRPAFSRP